jgi:hypothetical protein
MGGDYCDGGSDCKAPFGGIMGAWRPERVGHARHAPGAALLRMFSGKHVFFGQTSGDAMFAGVFFMRSPRP